MLQLFPFVKISSFVFFLLVLVKHKRHVLIRVRVPAGAGNFSLHRIQTGPVPTQHPIQWLTGDLSLGVKRSGREADHSPPFSADVKNAWSYTSTPPIRLNGVVLS